MFQLYPDLHNQQYAVFEVKHTENPYSGQYKNLENEELKNVMDYQYSSRKNVSVLYRGSSFKTPEEIYYVNISDFLKAADEYRDMDMVMDLLTNCDAIHWYAGSIASLLYPS